MKSAFLKSLSVVLLSFFIAAPAFSAPVATGFGMITQLRPMAGGLIYITHSLSACGTTVFSIDVSTEQGKALYAAIMASFTLQKKVSIEVDNAACAWGMPIRSAYINP